MANVYGVNATVALNTTPAGRVDGRLYGGAVRMIYDKYEASALATGNEIIVGIVEPGDYILPISAIQNDDLGGGSDATLDLVIETIDDATETAIIASIDADAAALTTLGTAIGNIDVFPLAVAERSYIKLKFAGTTAATGTIKSYIFVARAD
jgi:hypothetical protein